MAHIAIIVVSILLVLSTALAGYTYSQIRYLSLPIPQLLTLFAVLLPPILALVTTTMSRLLQHPTHARTILSAALFTLQTIYTTAIATLALASLSPGCDLEEQWARLFRSKDGDAIRRIQDRFECCGFNSAKDRAWPFASREGVNDPNRCVVMYGRHEPCRGAWAGAQRGNAGMLVGVAVLVFAVKIIILFPQFRNGMWTRTPTWRGFRVGGDDPSGSGENGDPSARLLIGEGATGRVAEEEEEDVGRYRDEIEGNRHGESGNAARENGNNSDSRPRIEPSRLVTGGDDDREGGSAPWRDGV